MATKLLWSMDLCEIALYLCLLVSFCAYKYTGVCYQCSQMPVFSSPADRRGYTIGKTKALLRSGCCFSASSQQHNYLTTVTQERRHQNSAADHPESLTALASTRLNTRRLGCALPPRANPRTRLPVQHTATPLPLPRAAGEGSGVRLAAKS